jgi:thioesterase domain-containing protein
LVAFAIAAKLEAMGEAVAALTLLESVPPVSDIAPDDSEETNAAMREAETASALLTLRAQVKEKLSRLPAEQAERFGQLSWELIEMSPDYRAPRIKAPLFLFRTPTHPKAVFQNWSQLSTGKLDERIVPGDAYSILAAPAVKLLGSRLDEALV